MLYPILPAAHFYILLGFDNIELRTDSLYRAVINPSTIKTSLKNIINLDSRGSFVKNGLEPTKYYWSFLSVPIGSIIQKIGFKNNGDSISFVPDKTGIYEVQLIVGDDQANSEPVIAKIEVSLLLTSEGNQKVPDVSFLWKLLGNSWDHFD